MSYKRILTIQDISCVGQCSLTVALPILSACGHETAVIPSAVLSTHTAGFSGYTFKDLTEEIPAISAHWKKEGIDFDAVYTGYLGSTEQIEYVKRIMSERLKTGGVSIVDPAMADNGKLYPAFGDDYVEEMKKLCFSADIILPNITEACFLTGAEYKTDYDRDYAEELMKNLAKDGAKKIVLTGVSFSDKTIGVGIYEDGQSRYYEHRLISKGCHGTGDIYSSAFAGALLKGKSLFDAAKIAADYTVECIENTQGDPAHWYGAKFEPVLPMLIKALE